MHHILPALKNIKKRSKSKAQGTLEFALASGVFLMMVFGIIEFGYLLYTYGTVFSAAREAARYGSSVTNEMDCAGIRAAAVRIGGLVGVSSVNTEVRYDTGPGDTRAYTALPACPYNSVAAPATVLGDRVIVRITVNYRSLTGVIPSMDVSSSDARTIIKNVDVAANFPTPKPVTLTPTSGNNLTATAIAGNATATAVANANATATAAALTETAIANANATATAASVNATATADALSSEDKTATAVANVSTMTAIATNATATAIANNATATAAALTATANANATATAAALTATANANATATAIAHANATATADTLTKTAAALSCADLSWDAPGWGVTTLKYTVQLKNASGNVATITGISADWSASGRMTNAVFGNSTLWNNGTTSGSNFTAPSVSYPWATNPAAILTYSTATGTSLTLTFDAEAKSIGVTIKVSLGSLNCTLNLPTVN